ncbi:hypothetical protein [Streptomyces dysideae]|uniref:Uncharacterized protein n=1 Tax=Streptomyces dysideae TaxID=909626 RepID=A0A117S1R3_9ACTN|nr:hypothetical protein [Streptomyces dysideae]KUO20689.1 hypothetical protein AQJ91_12225 [Streptomyces dysideae]
MRDMRANGFRAVSDESELPTAKTVVICTPTPLSDADDSGRTAGNTYRYVSIALVNETAAFPHELGVDLWDAIRITLRTSSVRWVIRSA